MRKRYFILFLMVLYYNAINIKAYIRSGANFLEYTPTARGTSLGDALTGGALDSSAIFFNPAGLGFQKSYEFMASHINLLNYIGYEYLSYITGFKKGMLGISGIFYHQFFNTEDSHRVIQGFSQDKLKIYDLGLTASYGYKFLRNLSGGIGLKYIRRVLDEYTAQTFAFDLGVIYKTRLLGNKFWSGKKEANFKDTMIGFSIHNIGAGVKFIEESDPLPVRISIGIAEFLSNYLFLFISSGLTVAGSESEFNYNAGLEILPLWIITPRIGISSGEIAVGAGIKFNLFQNIYKFDYAYKFTPVSTLGSTHWLSFSFTEAREIEKTIISRIIPFPDKGMFINDIVEEYQKEQEKIEVIEKKKITYKIKVNEFLSPDKYILARAYNVKLHEFILNEIEKSDKFQPAVKREDLIVNADLSIEGEILTIKVTFTSPEGKEIDKLIYSVPVKFEREKFEDVNYLPLIRVGDKIIIKKVEQPVEKKKDEIIDKLNEIAGKVVKYLETNILKLVSAHLVVRVNIDDVELYINGIKYGNLMKDRDYEISLEKGEYTLTFLKENYTTVKKKIKLKNFEKKKLNINLEEGMFYVDVSFISFPSRVKVYYKDKYRGKTPLIVKDVPRGENHFKFKYGKEEWEENIIIKQKGKHNFVKIIKYIDDLSKFNINFWRRIINDDVKVYVEDNKLIIKGRSIDNQYKWNGVVSPVINFRNCYIKLDLKSEKDNDVIIGFIDEDRNGFVLRYNEGYYQYYGWGKNETDKFITGIDIENKKGVHTITIKYSDGIFTGIVDDMKIVTEKIKLKQNGRFIILVDTDKMNKKIRVEIEHLSFYNGYNFSI